MPVNMDPAKKRRRRPHDAHGRPNASETPVKKQFGDETEEDRAKALADAEKKNLWDATEVIDMDTF
jgi:hypothetical protein